MKIVMVNNIFPPGFLGGYELGMLDVARGLQARGHGVTVLTSDYFLDERQTITEIDVIRNLDCLDFRRRPVSSAVIQCRGPYILGTNIRSLHAAMHECSPDAVVFGNLAGLGALGLVQFVVGAGYRPVLYLMDDVFHLVRDSSFLFQRYRSTCGLGTYLSHVRPITMSEVLWNEVRETIGPDLPAPVIVPGWYGRLSERGEVALRSRENDRCRFVFSSQLADHKGISILLRAVALAVERGARRFLVDLYGPGDSKLALSQARSLGLSDFVRYRGTVTKEEMGTRFAEYDALLMPTWEREPFGFVVPEAAANGCLPIITAQMGAAEWFLDGVDCFKLRRDPLAFAGAILRFLSLSADARVALRMRARKTALRHLGIHRWLGVIEQVIEDARMAGGGWDADRAERSRAAMLFLNDLWGTIVDDTL